MMKLKNHRTPQSCRSAFTLVEMLIVITIVVIIMSMTLGAFSFIRSSDRVSGAAGQVQSFFAGARDRAIYSDEMRGVRLFVEPAPPGSPPGASAFSRTITSMAYIGPGGTWSGPGDSDLIDLMRVDRGNGAGGPPDGDFDDPEDQPVIKIRGKNNPGWWNLKRRGWLVDGLRIRIPAGPAGNWYTINTSLIDATAAPTNDQFLLLEIPYAFSENTPGEVARRDQTYEIELPARILPQEPMLMPDGVVIDLDGSSVPNVWRPASTGNSLYSGYMDVWFSPRGNVVGDAAAKGVLHFYVCDSEDSIYLKEQFVSSFGLAAFDSAIGSGAAFIPMDEIDPTTVSWLAGTEKYIVKDRRIVTLLGQTGAISVHKVNAYIGASVGAAADDDSNGFADDPYRFAETGEEAK